MNTAAYRDLGPADRVHADLVLDLPPVESAALQRWLACAAVVAEVGAGGVIVRARTNRVFCLADLATLVREWMHTRAVEAVLASYDGTLLVITRLEHSAQRPEPLRIFERRPSR
jgi:hypothetical protein